MHHLSNLYLNCFLPDVLQHLTEPIHCEEAVLRVAETALRWHLCRVDRG